MCQCEQRKLQRHIKKLAEAGNDLVASIENANWGTIRHATMHMTTAVAVWKEALCHLQPPKADE